MLICEAGDSMMNLWGNVVCESGLYTLLSCSRKRGDRLLAAIRRGALMPPPDLRAQNSRQETDAARDCDAYCFFLYEFVAEPLAETDDIDDSEEDDGITEEAATLMGRLSCDPQHMQTKWIGYTKVIELYEQYKHWHAQNDSSAPASEATFRRRWALWRKTIRIRQTSQHARCDTCATISRQRSSAESTEEKDQAAHAHAQHLQKIMADRSADTRANMLSQDRSGQHKSQHRKPDTLLNAWP